MRGNGLTWMTWSFFRPLGWCPFHLLYVEKEDLVLPILPVCRLHHKKHVAGENFLRFSSHQTWCEKTNRSANLGPHHGKPFHRNVTQFRRIRSWEVKSTETWKPWGLRKSELLVQRFIVSVDESKNAWTLWITFKMKKPICSTLSLSSFSKLSKVFSLHRHGLKKDWDQTQTQNWS